MIELLIGAAVIGGALLLGKNKNGGGSGSSDFDDTFSDPGGFTPGSNPSKTDKVLQTAGQVIQTASAAAAALKAADFNFKKNHAIKFLQEGCKVKAFVFFRGREIVFKVQGEILLLRFANELEEWGKAEQLPVLEGKKMLMLIGPRKK